MTIALTGASGFLGRRFADVALRRGHEIVALSRTPERALPGCEMRRFTVEAPPDLRGCEAVVHLAGESVFGVWTAAKRRRIVESRVLGTRRVVEAIAALADKPEVFVCGSAIGFYGDRGEEELTESSPAGRGFFAGTVQAWEAEAVPPAGVRTVLLRTALVLGRRGGALGAMAPIFRCGLGGPIASGRQWVSWIHHDDHAALTLFAVENLDVAGPLNATAPWPLRNAELTRALARALRRPAFLRVPAFALRAVLGKFSAELLDSKRVLPAAATAHGFAFPASAHWPHENSPDVSQRRVDRGGGGRVARNPQSGQQSADRGGGRWLGARCGGGDRGGAPGLR
jgi:hypothetical protein